jgi:hypothetical protein
MCYVKMYAVFDMFRLLVGDVTESYVFYQKGGSIDIKHYSSSFNWYISVENAWGNM